MDKYIASETFLYKTYLKEDTKSVYDRMYILSWLVYMYMIHWGRIRSTYTIQEYMH